MSFGGMYFTNKGRALQAKSQIGTQLKFTRIAVGDGSLSGQQIQDMTFLIHEVKSLQITKIKTLPDGKATIGGVLSNEGIQTGFYWRELGLYAQDPDLGEILYCYGNANTLAEYIPAQGGADILEKQINIVAIIGNAANVTASINQSLIYASQADMDNKVDKVTGKQLSTEDYTTAEKQKLAGLSNYVHPDTHPSTMIVMGDGSSLEQYKSSVSSRMTDTMMYSTSKTRLDSNGIYTEVDLKRKNGSLIMKSVLNGGTSPKYTTRTETYYAQDGTTITNTVVYTLSWDSNGNISSEVMQ